MWEHYKKKPWAAGYEFDGGCKKPQIASEEERWCASEMSNRASWWIFVCGKWMTSVCWIMRSREEIVKNKGKILFRVEEKVSLTLSHYVDNVLALFNRWEQVEICRKEKVKCIFEGTEAIATWRSRKDVTKTWRSWVVVRSRKETWRSETLRRLERWEKPRSHKEVKPSCIISIKRGEREIYFWHW